MKRLKSCQHRRPTNTLWLYCVTVTVAFLLFITAGHAQQLQTGSGGQADWCGTQSIFAQRVQQIDNASSCPGYGDCDLPAIRDTSIPTSDQPFTTIRLMFHIVARDDGSSAATNPAMIEAQVANLNEDYRIARINFECQYDYIYSTAWRLLSETEFDSMKTATAVQPDSMLNIWVTFVTAGYSFGTFPWDPLALTAYGGVVMTEPHFSPVQSTLAHEIGHCLGLWHTHHGVTEVTQCSPCYERANSADGDVTGDFCEDTDPTPLNNYCTPPATNDPCTGQSWGPTDVQNFMGYSGDACWSEFSAQQLGRMHCWLNSKLRSWTGGVRFTAANTLGPVPLSVSFNGITGKVVSSWAWDFGDGHISDETSPEHSYQQPGLYDVKVRIEADGGPYESIQQNLVWAYADTLWVDSVVGLPGQKVRVDIRARNCLPITGITLPFTWDSPAGVTLDSISTEGLRTAYMGDQGYLNLDDYSRRAAVRLKILDDGSQPALVPGTGTVLSLFFQLPSGVESTVPVSIISYSNALASYAPTFAVGGGDYSPVDYDAAIIICHPGDINGDDYGPDLSDLSTLIGYLYGTIPQVPNPPAGNVDGKGIIDLSDLSYLIAYLLTDGASPKCKL